MSSVQARRFPSLHTVVLNGTECLPFSKFALIVDIVKARIANEYLLYSSSEQKVTQKLLNVINALQLLFLSQDTPLFGDENSIIVKIIADDLIYNVQEPLTQCEIPLNELRHFQQLESDFNKASEIRNHCLEEFANTEIFLRNVNFTSSYSFSCLLGLSQKVRVKIEELAKFNGMITNRVNIMKRTVGYNRILQVKTVLDYVDKLEDYYKTCFPLGRNEDNSFDMDFQ